MIVRAGGDEYSAGWLFESPYIDALRANIDALEELESDMLRDQEKERRAEDRRYG